MRIAARLAMHDSLPIQSGSTDQSAFPQFNSQIMGYHGCDVVVCDISESGFEAEVRGEIPEGALVRLRLPGAGVMVARVLEGSASHLRAAFLNPVSKSRLRMTLGFGDSSRAAAA